MVSCRLCGAALSETFIDLGNSPPCESFLTADQLHEGERFYPLNVWICSECLLVQLEAYVDASEIFPEYAYFSSYSDSWVQHAKTYADAMVERFTLTAESLVLEIASNDGYLLQHFMQMGIPSLGVDPAANVAEAAETRGVPTLVEFFDPALAARLVEEGRRPNLVVANNVLAQVPELNDFVAGIELVLADHGVLTVEVPHLVRLIEGLQFDTIYHEHYSYFSAHDSRAALRAPRARGLRRRGAAVPRRIAPRVRQAPRRRKPHPVDPRVDALLAAERNGGYDRPDGYRGLRAQRRRDQVAAARAPDRATTRRQLRSSATAPRERATPCSTTAAFAPISSTTRSTENPYKQGKYPPGNAHSDLCSDQDR